ncbi:MAG: TRAP transporter small permease [Saccharospirillum sp.]|nr:TRAP transporter small permease [Saccharospirillum sp.]
MVNLKSLLLGHGPGNSLFGYLVDGLNAVGSLLIFAIMALICADVFSRNVFNQPIAGVAEMVAASIVMIVFLQLASNLRHGRMAQADIFIHGFTVRFPRAGHSLVCLFYLVGAYMMYIVYKGTLPVLERAINRNQFFGVEGVFTFPVWPIRTIVVCCAVIALIQFLTLALDQAWKVVSPRARQSSQPEHPRSEEAL